MLKEKFYIQKYVANTRGGLFLVPLILFAITFISIFTIDGVSIDSLFVLCLFLLTFFAFLGTRLPILRFKHLIRLQEEMFQIKFDDRNAKPLHQNSLVYLSDDWLIVSGQYAFYREFIKNNRIMIQVDKVSRYHPYFIRIDGVNNVSYRFLADSTSSAKAIKDWSKVELLEKNDNLETKEE